MAGGWTRDGAVQDQIDASVEDAVSRARSEMARGESLAECEECGAVYECPNCDISMTLHRRAGLVCCHYCGLKLPYTSECPVCHHTGMAETGKGTERVSVLRNELRKNT